MDTPALPQRIRIRETPDGVTITINNRMSWFAFWVNVVFLLVILSASGIMFQIMIYSFGTSFHYAEGWEHIYKNGFRLLIPLIFTGILLAFLITIVQNLLWLTKGREVFFIKNGQLSIQIFGIFISRKYEYAIGRIKKFRLKKRPQPRYVGFPNLGVARFVTNRNVGSLLMHLEDLKEGSLAFDYEGESIILAHDLNMEEARAFYPVLLGYLKAEIKEGD